MVSFLPASRSTFQMRFGVIAGVALLTQLSSQSTIPSPKQYGAIFDTQQSLQTILESSPNDPAYTYPTDLTRDIIPKPIHSHNDYWREIPFLTALSNGCISIEADVWLFNDTLYVGHNLRSLTTARTFDSLYIRPILKVLSRQNPEKGIVQETAKYGVFDTDFYQTLYLFVDVKTDGSSTWPAVVRALQPLREKGYLTSFNSTVVPGAVTVIGTGGTPLDQIRGVQPRDYFFDADLSLLNSTQSDITSDVSPIASSDFSVDVGPVSGTGLNESQLALVRSQLAVAKSKGIGGRYYETPGWPISTRNSVWRTLIDEGVALLNADDLPAAAGFSASSLW